MRGVRHIARRNLFMEAGAKLWPPVRDILNCTSSTGFWGSVGIGGSWPSRMPPCPPQQSRNRGTQLPTLEPGEMELTWQEIMSITELQVSWVGAKIGELGWAEASRVLDFSWEGDSGEDKQSAKKMDCG